MKIYKNVIGTQSVVKAIEFNKDTVYVRNNIKKIDTNYEDNTSNNLWQYDEIQYTYTEWNAKFFDDFSKIIKEQDLFIIEQDLKIMEIQKVIPEVFTASNENFVNSNKTTFNLLKRAIEHYQNKKDIKKIIDIYFNNKKITELEKNDLLTIINK